MAPADGRHPPGPRISRIRPVGDGARPPPSWFVHRAGTAAGQDNLQGERNYLGWTFTQYNHTKVIMMAMSHVFAERVAGTGVTVNAAYPGHACTPGDKATPIRAFPLVYRPLVPLIRLLGPVLPADLAKPARSSLHLASSAEVEGVDGTYFGTDGKPKPWPASVRDERNRKAIWELCEQLSDVDVAW